MVRLPRVVDHKRGADFRSPPINFCPGDDARAWTIAARIKDPAGNYVAEMVVERVGGSLVQVHVPASETENWPLARLAWDLRGTRPVPGAAPEVAFTETEYVNVIEGITDGQ